MNITVMTGALLTFTMEAGKWEPVPPVQGGTVWGLKVLGEEKQHDGMPYREVIAEFADIHAVYVTDKVVLVPDGDDEE